MRPGATANSEEWNGSSWTEGNNMTRGTTGSDRIYVGQVYKLQL